MKCRVCNREHPENYKADPYYCIARLNEDLDAAVDEKSELKDGLGKLEWVLDRKFDEYICPVCGVWKIHKMNHLKDCWLNTLLKDGEKGAKKIYA